MFVNKTVFFFSLPAGLMGRGLGGMKERAQNEDLMEGKFAEKISDESDVDMENRKTLRRT